MSNFHPLEVVDRDRETHLRVDENQILLFSALTTYQCLAPHILNQIFV